RRIQAAWDLRIQVSPDHAACRNCRHDPEGNSGESLELERGVKSDDERGGESQKHVNVEPMPRIALFQQPRPALSQGIKKDGKEYKQAEKSQLQSNRAAGPQNGMFRRERPMDHVQPVIFPPVNRQSQQQRNGCCISKNQSQPVASVTFRDMYRSGTGRGRKYAGAHCLATYSSVLTENCL